MCFAFFCINKPPGSCALALQRRGLNLRDSFEDLPPPPRGGMDQSPQDTRRQGLSTACR